MIKINKNFPAPAILTNALTVSKTTKNESDYLSDSILYTSAVNNRNKKVKSFEFDSNIYGHKDVKGQLIGDQFEKCCFCEAKFIENSYGDVEHFRPKTAYTNLKSKSLIYPGYYWLAYDWNNLMFSCEKCNRSYKKNHFPLDDESTRKLFHNHPNILDDEDSLLVNPITEEPTDFITFKSNIPVPVNNSKKGKMTIDIFKLERMNNIRLDYLKMLKAALVFKKINRYDNDDLSNAMDILDISRDDLLELIDNADHLFNNAAKDTGEFAHCVRVNFPELPTI
ncbi:MAG: hypothetical protein REI96_22505 [Flavobacterium nitrogenifigens]|uniref:hypothetical protein n=1 Tax=Flavobacterium nitrogenifigens TaxID=1617283 RepID=UPI00280693A9|nr:hypothetical protein [Flavobacterium nitrogenifigens]MDQ8015235.1 hypothetical protein [Flavobacterium nitrogenifigens]